MSDSDFQVGPVHRLVGTTTLLAVLVALVGNVVVFAWMRPYGILRDLGPVAQAREQIHARFVDEVDDQVLLDAAIQGMAQALGDRNTDYFSAEELAFFEEHVGGEFTGIGAEIDIHENRLRIVAPLDDSPAWRSGVLPGDIVLEIDGEDTLGIDIFEAMTRLKGPAGTTVEVKVRHLDGETNTLVITRDTIEVASVRGYRRDPGNGYYYMIDPQHKIAYVRLTQFGEKSYNELYERLVTLKNDGMKALILDLRDNGGGLLDGAVAISDLFLPPGKTIVSTQGRAETPITAISTAQTLLPDLPVVVLVNENSASASEILAGALRDNDRALLVGMRTFGKGSVQQMLYLGEDQKTALKLTTAFWYIPSGKKIHREEGATEWGVEPSANSFVPMDEDQVRAMLLKRRAVEADDPYQSLTGPITPQWLRENLLDDQLAAALQAAQGRLDSGAWPKVGVKREQAIKVPNEQTQLNQRRKELIELLEQLDEQIEELKEQAEANDASESAEDATPITPEPAAQPQLQP